MAATQAYTLVGPQELGSPVEVFMTVFSRLNLLALVLLGVDSIVGVGIYFGSGELARKLGAASPLAFLLCAVLLSIVVLALGRLALRTQRNGGPYIYASLAFGPRWAYYLGWLDWLGAAIGIGAIAGLLGSSVAEAFHSEILGRVFSSGLLLALAVLNVRGLKFGAWVMVVFTGLKLLPLVALALASLPTLWQTLPSGFSGLASQDWSSGLMIALFACQGFEVITVVAGESEAPSRTIPLALLLSLWIAILLYLPLQALVVARGAGGNPALIQAASSLWGSWGGAYLRGGLLFSVLGLLAGRCLVAPRYLTPLGEDGAFPESVGRREARSGSPRVAIGVTTIVALMTSWVPQSSQFLNLSALAIGLQYLVSASALWVICRRERTSSWLGLGAMGVSLLFIVQAEGRTWLHLLGITAMGFLVQQSFRLTQPSTQEANP